MHSTRLIDRSQTALAEEHNLYFVAFAEHIWVYEPTHDVKNHEPVQIVHTLQSVDGLQGYLSRHRPHAINNILVAKLGTEEVLACVRDDGDCEVFMLRHILSAIENYHRNASADMLKLAFDRPIYRINVGSSAWGLSIHSEARMLAVSSNLHEITVIKFALVDPSEDNVKPSKRRALGQDHTEELPDATTDPTTWDLSRTIRYLGDTSDRFLSKPPSPFSSVSDLGSSGSDDMDLETTISLGDAAIVGTDEDDGNTGSNLTPMLSDADNDMYDDVEDEQTEDTVNPAMLYGGDRICGNKPRFQQATGICDDLPCPILHASLRNIYLLQPSRFNEIGRHGIFAPPVVGFARPLKQYIQGQHRSLNMFDRINMHAYIPSLGVVIMASQKGRAVVLALTKVKVDTQTIYAMRAECILPFASQEQSAEVNKPALRPFSPLHGIAVGPMPGCEGLRDEEKRWRLFMMYQDYTVLKYEIRRKDGQDAGVANVVI
ncbi:hypothetical protein B0A48_15316 [Cryoendolithus antarcticus]|uniref:Uncharacterized protein n=1 Tax=Cryoendolithus antarcticus TaxID=1507870 RepID=A0A1V8SI58_9PEZI|nr:hypothetical protein B0A48_15316 [Cryoendolithus antarcticus]